jgi:hypothetical protein
MVAWSDGLGSPSHHVSRSGGLPSIVVTVTACGGVSFQVGEPMEILKLVLTIGAGFPDDRGVVLMAFHSATVMKVPSGL